ncbi:MAG: hypothetical protein JNK64_38490 [Myxococcales bacterium]|nr:hypothetical protein [Myxococcales bacterium]
MAGEARGVDEVSTRKLVKAKAGPRGAWLENSGDCTSLPRPRGRSRRPDRGLAWTVAVSAVLATTAAAAAEPAPATRPVSDLDGIQLWIGPAGAARTSAAGWESTWGGGIQVLRIREHRALAAVGGWLGASHDASTDGGRVWLDAVAGTRRLGGWMLGVAAGPTVALAGDHHPRLGGAVAIWGFLGVVPVVRVGVLDEAGAFVEVGASLSLPAIRW